MERQGVVVGLVLGAMIALFVIALGVLWLARSSSTFANLKPGSPNSEVEAPSHQPAERSHELPDHPFEHMGIASLSPSTDMPEHAISEAQAIDRVTESTWGAYRDELIKDYPPSVIPAVYNASESVMGPAAQERPVWVVTLEGWGLPGRCAAAGPPGPKVPESQLSSEHAYEYEGEFIPGKSSAYAIVDAISGQILGSWHYGRCGGG